MTDVVLTDGFDCFIRLRRGVYSRVDRSGQRMGGISTNFVPAPRWRPAKRCVFDAQTTLWCERCGAYDVQYAESGERSFCYVQSRKAAEYRKAAGNPSTLGNFPNTFALADR